MQCLETDDWKFLGVTGLYLGKLVRISDFSHPTFKLNPLDCFPFPVLFTDSGRNLGVFNDAGGMSSVGSGNEKQGKISVYITN